MHPRCDSRPARRYGAMIVALWPMACIMAQPAQADLVLLDEFWTPEIIVNEVEVSEIDTVATGDPSQAKFGEWSARLTNATGAPSVRFRGATCVQLTEVPALGCEGRLWYRTDAWSGTLALEIWVFHHTPEMNPPAMVLRAFLDGGGEDGALIPDDQWHEARGVFAQTPDYEQMPKDIPLDTFVWLRPTEGWDMAHTTYIDRVEVLVSDTIDEGEPAPEPARRIRPEPGRQFSGDGWVWWEGEDAVEHNIPPGGAFTPHTAEQQHVLSNDAWLAHHGVPDYAVTWEVDVAEQAEYDLWVRELGTSFDWRWDGGDWQTYRVSFLRGDLAWIRSQGGNELELSWVRLGRIALTEGEHVLEARAAADDGQLGFDCWLLSRELFRPKGAARPTAK